MSDQQGHGRFSSVAAALIIWLGLALAASAAGSLRNARPQMIPMIVALLTVITLVVCWRLPAAQLAAMSLDVWYILGFHLVRFVAALFFLIDASNGRLAAHSRIRRRLETS